MANARDLLAITHGAICNRRWRCVLKKSYTDSETYERTFPKSSDAKNLMSLAVEVVHCKPTYNSILLDKFLFVQLFVGLSKASLHTLANKAFVGPVLANGVESRILGLGTCDLVGDFTLGLLYNGHDHLPLSNLILLT